MNWDEIPDTLKHTLKMIQLSQFPTYIEPSLPEDIPKSHISDTHSFLDAKSQWSDTHSFINIDDDEPIQKSQSKIMWTHNKLTMIEGNEEEDNMDNMDNMDNNYHHHHRHHHHHHQKYKKRIDHVKLERVNHLDDNEENECKKPGDLGMLCYEPLPGPFKYTTHLSYWAVSNEDTEFWNKYGKAIANKNLFISIGNLLLAFAIWLVWSIVTVLILDSWEASNGEYFAFDSWKKDMTKAEYKAALWVLPATAGLSGATLRITNAFMIAPSGGRNVVSQTSILLLIPMIMLTVALNKPKSTSLEYLILIALLTGSGGGAFASSASNISFFYPKSKQGFALGLNAGIGNLGVSLMQILSPMAISYGIFNDIGDIHFIQTVGYVANAAIIWLPLLLLFIIFAWFFMNSLPQHEGAANTFKALVTFYWLEFLGYFGAGIAVIVLILSRDFFISHPGLNIIQAFILWIIAVVITVFFMKYLICCNIAKKNICKTIKILSFKHTWIMTYLYVMTFGSFIGFSASFPLIIKELFPNINPLTFAWLGPFVGSISRPFGGWISDKFGGARVTHWNIIIMIICTICVGITIIYAKINKSLFPIFLILFLFLFILTGIGNASTFGMIPIIFTNQEQAGPVLGWTSAIAGYGAFVIPIIFSASIEIGCIQYTFFAFSIYYTSCLAVNYYYYHRKNAEKAC